MHAAHGQMRGDSARTRAKLTLLAYACRVNGNLNLSRAIGDLKYKGNDTLAPKDQIITAQPDIEQVCTAAYSMSAGFAHADRCAVGARQHNSMLCCAIR